MRSVELSNSTWHLSLLPEWGGRVAALAANGLDILVPFTAPAFDPLAWPKQGAYPLIPYSNRIKDSQLHWCEQSWALPAHPAALPHTLHGISHTLAWEVVFSDEQRAVLAGSYDGEHWPWPIAFEQSFELQGQQLHVVLAVTNQGSSPMPAGVGFHPFFACHEAMRVSFGAGLEWPINGDYLPVGVSLPLSGKQSIAFDSGVEQVRYLSDWDLEAEFFYRQGHLRMVADPVLSHLVVALPEGAPYLCFEPVSHLANAFNAQPAQFSRLGTRLLNPGERLEGSLTFTWQPSCP